MYVCTYVCMHVCVYIHICCTKHTQAPPESNGAHNKGPEETLRAAGCCEVQLRVEVILKCNKTSIWAFPEDHHSLRHSSQILELQM